MATESVPITAGTGTDIAVDAISAKNYQRVKLTDGTDDSETRIAAGGGTEATALRVTVATDSTGVLSVDDNGGNLSIDDGGNSITVDAPTGTPVNVKVGDGSLQAGVVDETGASAVDALAVGGGTAHDAVDSGNPQKIGGYAKATAPTAVADGDRVNAWFTTTGALNVVSTSTSSSQSINGHQPGGNSDQLGKVEDAGHTTGDTGVFVLSVRQSEANSLTSSAGSDADYAAFNTDARGLLQVVARPYVSRIRVASSGLSTGAAYAIGDTAGTIMTFAGCARVSGGTGTILSATLLDKGDVGTDYRLHIYRATVTLSADNAAWAVSDSDQESLIGLVTMPSLLDVGANRVATLANIGLPYDCAATSLFVGIETRTTNVQYAAATDLHLILTVCLD